MLFRESPYAETEQVSPLTLLTDVLATPFMLNPSICGGPQEYIAYELVLASPAVSRVSGSSDLYSFRDGGQVSV